MSKVPDRDRTAEVALYVTRLNIQRVLEHQEAAINSQILFLEGAEQRLAGARARKQSVLDELALARARVEVAAKSVPFSVLRALEAGADELGEQSGKAGDVQMPAPEIIT